jgi:hypothetical protein
MFSGEGQSKALALVSDVGDLQIGGEISAVNTPLRRRACRKSRTHITLTSSLTQGRIRRWGRLRSVIGHLILLFQINLHDS